MLAPLGLFACGKSAAPKCFLPGPKTSEASGLVELQASALMAAKAANFHCQAPWGDDVMALKYSAKRTMSLPMKTVVDKSGVAPSGDRHDYFSIGRYFWPDPDKPNGLPWKRRDGQVNPDILTGLYDKASSDAMFRNVANLASAYFFLGDEAYAAKAAEYLRAWFIDPATRMNPRLDYAEGVPGDSAGRSQGLIEFSKMPELFDAIALLEGSAAWTVDDAQQLRAWVTQYHEWLNSAPNALGERAAKNNHGTYFDVQHAAVAIYLGDTAEARRVIEEAKRTRTASQVQPDGFQPLELARASSWFYSVFNLSALMDLGALGDRVGVDFWHFETEDGRSIQAALDALLPYAFDGKDWPHPGGLETGRLFEPLLRASAALGEPRYAELANSMGDTDHDGYAEDDERERGTVRLQWGFAEGSAANPRD